MPTRHRSAWRRRQDSRARRRTAVTIGIPVALAVVVGAIIAVSHGLTSQVSDSALANCASPAAFAAAAASGTHGRLRHDRPGHGRPDQPRPPLAGRPDDGRLGTAAPTTAASGTTAPTTAAPRRRPARRRRHRARARRRRASTPAAAAAANVNCDIIVPANPLSAQGLATPYQLTGPDGMTPAQSGCTMANAANLGAFVQATIVNTQTGQLSVYDPLVITQGTTPAVAPTVPTLPAHYVATIDFGFNGTDLTQVGATANALRQGDCVNGQAGSVFGQVSFCNGTNFFNEAFLLEREGKLTVPSEGTSGKIVASGGQLGTGQDLPDHAQLRHDRPGPVGQRDLRVPAQPGDRADRAGHHGERGQHRRLHAAGERQ